ncbi:MAG: hypothetical protein K0V04_00330 [Deltaproteobacteria bacterium]|nr:hypothetical protein [Deltaproteobacteria bacterium]
MLASLPSGLTGVAFALLAKGEKYPDFPPEFAVYCGWLVFALVLLVCAYSWVRIETVRRFIYLADDPRVFAALRIGFAIMTIACFLNLEPYWRMLWSDEGIFDLEYAQDKLGRQSLRGWSPEEGFFDGWAILNFVWHKPSLLFMWGSPKFVFGYMMVFFFVLVLYGAGVFSRTTGLIAWFLMSGIYNRNALYWEGTDTVYRCFWWILLFAKTGHAWSFDNWWRCRRLRKKGRLEDPDAPEGTDQGQRQPIYRRVPAWPRYLFMMQLAALYLTTGAVKTGSVWAAGDALYYALNMDHFYRFEWTTQQVSAALGTNVFRLNTWVTHWWERLFPLLLVGMALRFSLRHRDQPWYRAYDKPWRRWGGRALLVAIWALLWRLNYLVLPFCLAMKGDRPVDPSEAIVKIHIAWGIIIPTLVVAWYALGRWPITVLRHGRSLGWLTERVPWLYIPELHFNQHTMRAWLLGRRVWLALGIVFHGFLIAFMNIGMFAFIMLMTYAAMFEGEEIARVCRGFLELMRKIKGVRRLVPKGYARWFVPAQAPSSVPIRGRTVPDALVLLFGLMGAGLIWAKVTKPEWIEDVGELTYYWMGLIAVVALVFRLLPANAAAIRRAREPGPALAYGTLGRALALLALVWHAGAVGTSLLPSYPILNKWRSPSAASFGGYLRGTGTNQSWRMFAPNPPRSNTFLKTVVVEHDGDRWDLRNNAFHYRPNPWIWNDRMRKMQRRMAGKGKWYLRYWAAWQCREWTLLTGETPYEIEISKLITRIPPPDAVAEKGPYHPRKLRAKERHIQTHKCKGDGELPVFMKERYGIPTTEEEREKADRDAERYLRKFSSRRTTWDNRRDMGNWGRAAEAQEERRQRAAKRREGRQGLVERRRAASQSPATPATPSDASPQADPPVQEQGLDDEGAPEEAKP